MPASSDDPRLYAALMIPSEALDKGGVEILRAGLVDDSLNVQALPVFDDPKHWGAVFAEIAERLAELYAAEANLDANEVLAAIHETFVAELAGSGVSARPAAPKRRSTRSAARKPATRKPPARRKAAAGTARKPVGRTAPKSKRQTKRKH